MFLLFRVARHGEAHTRRFSLSLGRYCFERRVAYQVLMAWPGLSFVRA